MNLGDGRLATLAISVVMACSACQRPDLKDEPVPETEAAIALALRTPRAPTTLRVAIRGMVFVPAELAVVPGDSVIWTNEDLVPHSATAKGQFDSGSIAADGHWQYLVSEHAPYHYHCTFHPTMRGTLILP